MTLVCGIDEAGRGPIMGPLVIAGVVVDGEGTERLKKLGVKDSKLLSPNQRELLFGKIIRTVKTHKILVVEPAEIDAAVRSGDGMNLNWLEAEKSAEIINSLNPDKAVIDCPSPNVNEYKRRFIALLENKKTELVIEHKADLNHVECAAASVLAKVTRDNEIEKLKKFVAEDIGSGYLTDPKTAYFFDRHFDTHPDIFRKSWAPYRRKADGRKQRSLDDF